MEREQITQEHGDASVSRERDNLTAGMADLRADCLRQSVRHGTVIEGAEDAAAAVHRQIARGPDRRSSHIAGKRRRLWRLISSITRATYWGWIGFLAGIADGEFVEAFAGFSIVFERGLEVLVECIVVELGQECADC